MGTWLAILISPLVALSAQSLAYALVPWSCSHGHPLAPHAVFVLALTACLALTLLALKDWRFAQGGRPRPVPGDPAHRRVAMSLVALLTGGLSALIVLALWLPQWMLSPCHA